MHLHYEVQKAFPKLDYHDNKQKNLMLPHYVHLSTLKWKEKGAKTKENYAETK